MKEIWIFSQNRPLIYNQITWKNFPSKDPDGNTHPELSWKYWPRNHLPQSQTNSESSWRCCEHLVTILFIIIIRIYPTDKTNIVMLIFTPSTSPLAECLELPPCPCPPRSTRSAFTSPFLLPSCSLQPEYLKTYFSFWI